MQPQPQVNDNTHGEMIVTRYVYRYHNDSLAVLNVLLLGMIVLLGLLWFFIFAQLGSEPTPLHFKLTENLQLIQPAPLDQEGIAKPALLNWVNEFVMKAFSFNYSNINNQPSKLAPYFSDTAMQIYTNMLTSDEDIGTLDKSKFIVSIMPKQPPEIVVGQVFKDRYAWQIQVTARILFSNALMRANEDVVFNFLVWRVPETESPLGVSVATFTYRTINRSAPRSTRVAL